MGDTMDPRRRLSAERATRGHAPSRTPRWRLGRVFRNLSLTAIAVAIGGSAIAAGSTMSLEQIQRKYRRMSIVHIEKCDRDRDGMFTKSEQLCVASIYDVMYRDHN